MKMSEELPAGPPCVVVIKNGVIDNIKIFSGQRAEMAERYFVKLCQESLHNSNCSTLDDEEIEEVVSEGYMETEGGTICLAWADDASQVTEL